MAVLCRRRRSSGVCCPLIGSHQGSPGWSLGLPFVVLSGAFGQNIVELRSCSTSSSHVEAAASTCASKCSFLGCCRLPGGNLSLRRNQGRNRDEECDRFYSGCSSGEQH